MTLLPEDTQPSPKQSKINNRTNRLLYWLVILLLLISLGTVVTIIGLQPGVVGLVREGDFNATQQVIGSTANAVNNALNLTAAALQTTGEFYSGREIELQSTQAALVNAANQINQTETQQRVNNSTTQTAVAAANAQQATQAALNFVSTQAALDAIGTQVQLDYQSTRDALNRILTSTPPVESQSDIFVIDEVYASGAETSSQLSASNRWARRGDGALIAQQDAATLITRRRDYTGYVLTVNLTAEKAGYYDVILNALNTEAPLVLRFIYDGAELTSAQVTPFNIETLPNGIIPDTSPTFGAAAPLETTPKPLIARISVQDSLYRVQVNDRVLFEFVYPAGGAVGLQVPAGTVVRQFSVED